MRISEVRESTDKSTTSKRNFHIDCLRGIAILLVLIHHASHSPSTIYPIYDLVRRGCWMGVDLFFVMSGFLVSGLLFTETFAGSKPDVMRFLIRRGFKIYPSYILLIATGWCLIALPFDEKLRHFGSLFFFIQNYSPSYQIFGHTWSLAVEEHFYALLALAFWAITAGKMSPLTLKNICLGFIFGIPIIRAIVIYNTAGQDLGLGSHYVSHLRMDSLATGVVLSYYWHYHRQTMAALSDRYKVQMILGGIILLSPAFLLERLSPVFFILGYSSLAIGSALLLLSVLRMKTQPFWMSPVSSLGKHSYSIYLWHSLATMAIFIVSAISQPLASNCLLEFIANVSLSIVFGITASSLVDWPMLKIRERLCS